MIESNDDIFNHIKSVMRDHEEPYDEGAWERFQAAPIVAPVKKGAISMWKWSMAAAAVLVAGLFLTRIFNSSESTPHFAKELETLAKTRVDSSASITKAAPATETQPPAIVAGEEEKAADAFTGNPGNVQAAASNQPLISYSPGMRTTITSVKPTIQKPFNSIIAPPATAVTLPAPAIAKQQPVTPAAVDFWKNKIVKDAPPTDNSIINKELDKQFAVAAKPALVNDTRKEKSNKWQPSLFVSPLFGDLGIDMGYGVAVAYAISDKIKISSGVAHTRISASRNYGAAPASEMMASAPNYNDIGGSLGPAGPTGAAGAAGAAGATGAKGPSLDAKAALTSAYNFVAGPQTNSLQQVEGSLSGIDIPVEINYNISKKLYASAGVSGLVVINDNKKYTYVDNRNVKVSVETNKGALKENKSVVFSEQNTTSQPIQAPTENTPFLGFYNISMGYRQKISGRTGVALEPFLKVPMKNVTQENLKYLGTGIRLKFDF